MNFKSEVMGQLITKIKKDLAEVKESLASSKSLATSDEMKSEGKYDTRGIEAGQLAGALQARVEDLEQELELLQETPAKEHVEGEALGIGSLVDLEFKGQLRRYFLCTTAGGTLLNVQDHPVLVISIFSPLGSALMGALEGEDVEVEMANDVRTYKVIKAL